MHRKNSVGFPSYRTTHTLPGFNLLRTSPRNQHAYCAAATILLSKLPMMAQGLPYVSRVKAVVVLC